MNRIDQFVSEYVGYMNIHQANPDMQAELLTEMVKDLVVEDRLRTLNLLDILGISLTQDQKNKVLGEEVNAF